MAKLKIDTRRFIVEYKRKNDGQLYSVSYPISTLMSVIPDGTSFSSMIMNDNWDINDLKLDKPE